MNVERSKNPALFFSEAEKKRIIKAIVEAELQTSGEIRVHLERKARPHFFEHAKEIFAKLGMTKTEARNGVLIFIGIASRRFAILGDEGIHQKVPENFWDEIARKMQEDFKQDLFADGICHAVETTGEQLRKYFPYEGERDLNELPDEISFSI